MRTIVVIFLSVLFFFHLFFHYQNNPYHMLTHFSFQPLLFVKHHFFVSFLTYIAKLSLFFSPSYIQHQFCRRFYTKQK